MMPMTCQLLHRYQNGGEDDAHTLYKYGSMPRALVGPKCWAYLWGYCDASYFAEDGLARCPERRCAGCIAVAGRDWEYQYPGKRRGARHHYGTSRRCPMGAGARGGPQAHRISAGTPGEYHSGGASRTFP